VQIKAMQMQILGKLVSVDMQIETWNPGAEVMREKISVSFESSCFEYNTGWPDCLYLCFDLF